MTGLRCLAHISGWSCAFGGITGSGSAYLKCCLFYAASPWSRSPSLDSQCIAAFKSPRRAKLEESWSSFTLFTSVFSGWFKLYKLILVGVCNNWKCKGVHCICMSMCIHTLGLYKRPCLNELRKYYCVKTKLIVMGWHWVTRIYWCQKKREIGIFPVIHKVEGKTQKPL